jgi:hypothetical protein
MTSPAVATQSGENRHDVGREANPRRVLEWSDANTDLPNLSTCPDLDGGTTTPVSANDATFRNRRDRLAAARVFRGRRQVGGAFIRTADQELLRPTHVELNVRRLDPKFLGSSLCPGNCHCRGEQQR